jgi:hypothetical protein
MKGILQLRTVKLGGLVKNKDATILIDFRSAYNFSNVNVAKRLNLFIYPTKDLTVMDAYCQVITRIEKCHKVSIQIQNFKLQMRYFTTWGMGILLGATWLMQLGTYATNIQKQFMKFRWKGETYKLNGFEPPNNGIISSQSEEKNGCRGTLPKGAAYMSSRKHDLQSTTSSLIML